MGHSHERDEIRMTTTAATRIHDLFEHRLASEPDRPFLYTTNGVLTLRDLGQLVDTIESELRAEQVLPGDRVMAVAENCPQHVALILACSRIGAWSCGANARMSRNEIDGFIAKADPRLVYFTPQVSGAAAAHADAWDAQPSALEGLRRTPRRDQAVAETGELGKQVAAIIFTSGTTGMPKGVMVSHAGLAHFGCISAESRSLGSSDLSYAYLPMTHIFGLGTVLAASLYAGAGLVMRSKFDPADVFDALAHQGVTNLQGPPAMFSRLLSWLDEQGIARPACPALRYLYTGAAPLDMALKQAVEDRFGQPLHHGYGLSEYAGALCLVRTGERRNDLSAGYLVEGGELRIVDKAGEAVAQGQRGEIWIRGIGLMPGYFRDAEATAAVMRPDGWYASGDLGYLDQDGALFVVGRIKEMIIRSGFNVYPGEVEAALTSFAGIHRAAVVGRKLADGNEEILAFIETDRSDGVDLQALSAHVDAHLAPYKRPSKILRIDALPTTLSGKVLKRSLLEQHADLLDAGKGGRT
jgi:acyl-CoA synthetase (AMP-forming)/AMP-acid ligase II